MILFYQQSIKYFYNLSEVKRKTLKGNKPEDFELFQEIKNGRQLPTIFCINTQCVLVLNDCFVRANACACAA